MKGIRGFPGIDGRERRLHNVNSGKEGGNKALISSNDRGALRSRPFFMERTEGSLQYPLANAKRKEKKCQDAQKR